YGVGPIIGMDASLLNFARADVEAVDVAIDYRLSTSRWGSGPFSVAATRNIHNETEFIPGSGAQEQVGLQGFLKWVANASLSWNIGPWSAAWQAQFYDKYYLFSTREISTSQGSATIPSQIYHDLSFGYDRPVTSRGARISASGSLLSGLSVRL